MNFYRLIQGDCLKVLHTFESESVDLVVTDPPYGISFMGKSWDKVLPPKKAFAEMFRVLKPGALAFVMSSPRQDVLWRMMSLLEDVDFELKQSPIYWTYASGFPKAYDVSLGIDRKIIYEKFIDEFGRKPTKEELNKLMETKRKVIDKYQYPDGVSRKQHERIRHEKGDFQSGGACYNIAEPYSDLAKEWSGWKSQTGLKPAVEVILMVNKPRSEKTIVDNVLMHGVGAVNVDECRIPFKSKEDLTIVQNKANKDLERYVKRPSNFDKYGGGKGLQQKYIGEFGNVQGRFPANLIISDNVLDTGIIHKSGKIYPHHIVKEDSEGYSVQDVYGKYKQLSADKHITYGDSGGFSRFFSLDAWFDDKFKRLPKDVQKTFPFLIVPKASKSERDKGLEQLPIQEKDTKLTYAMTEEGMKQRAILKKKHPEWSSPKRPKAKNIHPTVKPLKLMSYLVTLGCPSDGVVLDPFLGSGTTMLASWLMSKSCIGVEINPEYCEIAKARCFNRSSLFPKEYKFEIM